MNLRDVPEGIRFKELDTIPDEEWLHLERASFECFLTGSRYMQCAREDSDWDFIVQSGEGVREYFISLGWTSMAPEIDDNPYEDDEALDEVLQSPSGKVQVQLCKDAEAKRTVRDLIFKHHLEYHKAANKWARRDLWNSYFGILHSKRTVEQAQRDNVQSEWLNAPLTSTNEF